MSPCYPTRPFDDKNTLFLVVSWSFLWDACVLTTFTSMTCLFVCVWGAVQWILLLSEEFDMFSHRSPDSVYLNHTSSHNIANCGNDEFPVNHNSTPQSIRFDHW